MTKPGFSVMGLDNDYADFRIRYPLLAIAHEHAAIFEESLSGWPGYSFHLMHKHLHWYVRSVPGARALRRELLDTRTAANVRRVLDAYFASRSLSEIPA